MRNALGQALEIGAPVLVVSQGRGWTGTAVGRIFKYSKAGDPQVKYSVKGKHCSPTDTYINTTLDDSISPPLPRYERIVVISEGEFDKFVRRAEVHDAALKDFNVSNEGPTFPTGIKWGDPNYDVYHREYRDKVVKHHRLRIDFVNAAMRAAGEDEYYD